MAFEDSLFAQYPTEAREILRDRFVKTIPHNQALGIEFVDAEPGAAILRLPYDARLAGNPDTGTVHGGVITSLIDSAGGLAVFCALPEIETIATLDLRIDYMKPATPEHALIARADCYKRTRSIAFVRALAYHDDPNDPVATAAGAFMRSSTPAEGTFSMEGSQ